MAAKKECQQCKHWRRIEMTSLIESESSCYCSDEVDDWVMIGECRRMPPQIAGLAPDEVRNGPEAICNSSHWPVTWEFDECGEFKGK